MKVLDPQSALLTNGEVYAFLKSNAPRPPDKQIGSYPATNLTGYVAVRKDESKFDRYTTETTPHVAQQVNAEKWMPELVKRLKPYDLTKTEVLNLINIGVGIRVSQSPSERQDEDEEAEEEVPDEDAELSRDVQFLKVCVEEVEERFPGEEGEERMREIVTIIKEVVRSAGVVNGTNGVISSHANENST